MRLIEQIWFKDSNLNKVLRLLVTLLLLPLTFLFWLLSIARIKCFQWGVFKQIQLDVPVIVVGNISVGGNGKTPVVLWLIEQCLQLGFNVGVISRGYGGKSEHYPLILDKNTSTAEAGDEPVMIYQRTGIATVVGPDRIESAKQLIKQGCNIIISDDGLQHYRLARSIELAIVDGKRGFGNRLLIPAGPLREGLWRLKKVDHIIINGGDLELSTSIKPIRMSLVATYVVNIASGKRLCLDEFIQLHQKVNAIAGIGAPQRFFDTLMANKIMIAQHQAFADHYTYNKNDFNVFTKELPLLMTEKDAVKCQSFAKDYWWYLAVDAQFEYENTALLLTQISALKNMNNRK